MSRRKLHTPLMWSRCCTPLPPFEIRLLVAQAQGSGSLAAVQVQCPKHHWYKHKMPLVWRTLGDLNYPHFLDPKDPSWFVYDVRRTPSAGVYPDPQPWQTGRKREW